MSSKVSIQSFLFLPPGMKNLLSDNEVIQLLLAYDKDMLTHINEFPNHGSKSLRKSFCHSLICCISRQMGPNIKSRASCLLLEKNGTCKM